MKIRKISFINHPILGNLNFDFTDKDGKVVNTIILAGENGSGKSLLLNTIFEFSLFNLDPNKRDEKRIFEIQLSNNELDILKQNINLKHNFVGDDVHNILQVSIDYNIINNWTQVIISGKKVSGQPLSFQGHFLSQSDTKKVLRMIFSDVEINFTPHEIGTVTSKNVDRENIDSERSNSNLATEITQLLIDVQSIDALEFTEWARNNTDQKIDKDKIDIRIKRFSSAFDFMFPSKRYKRIETINNYKKVIFEENGLEMSIDKLSSGEKQVVFRGSFLLKDMESTKGAVILIDEPEISLHPHWQLKVLSFFKKLFTSNTGEQTSQIIVATHSPFILHNTNRNDDKVIVLQKNEAGQIAVLDKPIFYSWSTEKIVEEAFKVAPILSSNKIIVFLEGETDEKYFNKCLEVFNKSDKDIAFNWIGRINETGNAENTGDTALNQAKTFFSANPFVITNKIIMFYDSDTNKPEENIGKMFIRKMASNNKNAIFKIGVENLLDLPHNFDVSVFYKKKEKKDNYSAVSTITELDKNKLCSHLCADIDLDKQKIIFQNINKEIDRLLSEA